MLNSLKISSKKIIISITLFVVLFYAVIFFIDPSPSWLNSFTLNEPQVHQKYQLQIIKRFVRRIDNIVDDNKGGFYVSSERENNQGQIIHIDSSGMELIIIDKLDKPDGLKIFKNFLYIVEETPKGRLLEYDITKKTLRQITTFYKPEGLLILDKNTALISEDKANASVFKVDLKTGKYSPVINGLARPEGLARDSNGNIYVTQTAANKVSIFNENFRLKKEITGLTNPDQLLIDTNDNLWIGEDTKNARLLRYDGELNVIANHLSFLQGLLNKDNDIYVAEQGRNRLLKVSQL